MKKFFSIGALCAVLVLTGCKDKTFTVTFDSQGGSPVESIKKVESGSKITEPEQPINGSWDFAGWYREPACTNAWKFDSDVVTSNITLYAKWEQSIIGVVADLVYIDYYGNHYGSGAENFDLVFYADGNYYYFEMFSPTAETVGTDKIAPAKGTYEFDATYSYKAFTISGSSYVETGGICYRFESGKVRITKVGSNYKVVADLVDETGLAHLFTYKGELFWSIYQDEPTTKVNATINATKVHTSTNYGGWYGVGEELFFAVSDAAEYNGGFVDFICSGSGLTSLPVGTYPINATLGLNTVVAYCLNAWKKEGGSFIIYNENPYFLVSGNVVVNAGGFTLTGTSYHGSTFTLNYTGSLAVYTPALAPAKIAKKIDMKKPFANKIDKRSLKKR